MKGLAVITGASSGIGMEFAGILYDMDYSILIVARRLDRLEALKNSLCQGQKEDAEDKVHIFQADLSDREEIKALLSYIDSVDMPLSVFINCAGFGLAGPFKETSLDRELSMIDVNVTALHILTKEIIKRMDPDKSQDSKYIMNVASSAGLFPGGPYMATYYASKAYVTSLTRALYQELKEDNSKIVISCLCPGPVDTEFNSVADVKFSLKGISASYCAKYAVDKMFEKKTVIVPTLRMKIAIFGVRLLPYKLMVKLTGNQQKKKFKE